jgi:hypothetical protein
VKRPHLISILICIYCMTNAADLFEPWMEPQGWSAEAIAFSLWSAPLVSFWGCGMAWAGENPPCLGLSLFLSFYGAAVSLRTFCHLGFALSLAAMLPAMPIHLAWVLSSCSWMPAFDWLGCRFFPGCTTETKIIVASLPALYLVWHLRRMSRGLP